MSISAARSIAGAMSLQQYVPLDPFDIIVDRAGVLAFQLTRAGGVMIFDDYPWSMEPHPAADPLNTPKFAIDTFTTAFARKVRVLPAFPNEKCYVEKIGN